MLPQPAVWPLQNPLNPSSSRVGFHQVSQALNCVVPHPIPHLPQISQPIRTLISLVEHMAEAIDPISFHHLNAIVNKSWSRLI